MSKNYLHIILSLWCALSAELVTASWASPAMASFENLGSSNIKVFVSSKDSLNKKASDTTITLEVTKEHLPQSHRWEVYSRYSSFGTGKYQH